MSNIEGWLKLANDDVTEHKYSEAETYYRKVLEINPDNLNAEFGKKLCNCYEKFISSEIYNATEDCQKFKDMLNKCTDNSLKAFMLSSIHSTIRKCVSGINDTLFTIGSSLGASVVLNLLFRWYILIEFLVLCTDFIEENSLLTENEFKDIYIKTLDTIIGSSASIVVVYNHADGVVRVGDDTRKNAFKYYDNACLKMQKYAPNEKYVKVLDKHRLTNDKYWSTTTTTSNNYSTNSSNNGCYIATCVYGSYDCPEVWTLRRFRDYTLDTSWYGRAFIQCYYAISPTLVKWFGQQKWFRTFWKNKLDSMVFKLNQKGIKDTQYQDKY